MASVVGPMEVFLQDKNDYAFPVRRLGVHLDHLKIAR
jgi:hypothetical protein